MTEPLDISAMRVGYAAKPFDVADLAPTWWQQLHAWLAESVAGQAPEPNAMVLATASADGEPHSRTVLCKGIDADGVRFYTNLGSAKSSDLLANPRASATFCWLPLHRQVHVSGPVQRVDEATTQEYWRSRPRGSQLGAWASPQSTVVPTRAVLDERQQQVAARFTDDQDVPLPPFWGGWQIVPRKVEFWQGRTDRLHDRLRFRQHDGAWVIERLAP